MKYLIVAILLMPCFFPARAQNSTVPEIQVWAYNKVFFGRNYVISYLHHFDSSNVLGIGLSYHHNPDKRIGDQNWTYLNRYRAFNFGQRIGFDLEYRRYITLGNEHVKLFPFYNLSIVRMGLRHDNEYLYGYDTVAGGRVVPLFSKSIYDYPDPFFTFNQTIGLGIRAEVTKWLAVTGRVGFASATLVGVPNLGTKHNVWYEFSGTYSLGMAIRPSLFF